MLFLGEETLLVLGALSRLGYFDFWWAFVFALAGALTGNYLWYQIGRKHGEKLIKKYGRWLCVTPERFQKIKIIIKKRGIFFLLFQNLCTR